MLVAPPMLGGSKLAAALRAASSNALGFSDNLPLCARGLVYRLADVVRFRESAAIGPCQLVANLEPGVFDGAGHPVISPGPAERRQMPARLQDPPDFGPSFRPERDVAAVPLLAHEALRRSRISARLSNLGWGR